MGNDDKTFQADESGQAPGPAVSDKVKQGGTRPQHDGDHQDDRSPHDADKKQRPDIAPDPDKGEAGLDHGNARRSREAEEQERALSIDAEDRDASGN